METFPTAPATHQQSFADWVDSLTIADGLLALILLAAGIMRLVSLGHLPLSDTEAIQALAVWQFWQPDTAVLTVGSSAYFSLTSWLTQLFGFDDWVMRLIPALFGIGLAYLPWLLRHRLGTQGALVTAVLLAISPINSAAARTAGGNSIAMFALLLLFVAFIRYQETNSVRWLYTLFAALGLGLASSAVFYSGLVTLLLAWLIHSRLGLSLFVTGEHAQANATWRQGAAVGIVVFLLLSSFFLLLPTGIGTSARLLGEWFQQFGGSISLDPLLAFVRYEPALVILGLIAIVWAILRNKSLALFTVYWLSSSLILLLLQRQFMENALLLTLPAALLIGIMANAVWQRGWDWLSGSVALAGLVGSLVLLVNVARLGRTVQQNPQEGSIYLMIILLTVILTGLILYFAAVEDSTAVTQGFLLAMLGIFIFYQWGTAWWMGQAGINDPRERWVTTSTDMAMRELADTVRVLSRQLANSNTQLEIGTTIRTPALAWYLRDYAQLQQFNALPVTPTHQVFITPENNSESPLTVGYTGTDFPLRRLEIVPSTTSAETIWYDTFRWWFFHESTAVVPIERAILWVRADLVTGQP